MVTYANDTSVLHVILELLVVFGDGGDGVDHGGLAMGVGGRDAGLGPSKDWPFLYEIRVSLRRSMSVLPFLAIPQV